MKRKIYLLFLLLSFACPAAMLGQVKDPFNAARQSAGGSNAAAFNKNRRSNFNDYRQKLNAEYASQTRGSWKGFNAFRGEVPPDRDAKPVAPVVMSDEEARKGNAGNEIRVEGVAQPSKNNKQPQPIAPVQEVPDGNDQSLKFSYLGTSWQVRMPQGSRFSLVGVGGDAVADAWEVLSGPRYSNLVVDCIRLRSERRLCDWAYLMMLQALGNSYCGEGTNEATLLMAFLFSQSGYKIRLGTCNGKLQMLYASQHDVYGRPYVDCGGEKFFALSDLSGEVRISAARFPKEQSLSLWVERGPQVDFAATSSRRLVSKRYPEMAVEVGVNKNLLPFYDSYPSSEVGGNFMTRWAMYANTPICPEARDELYPQLKRHVGGCSQQEAVERLLNWVQTAFTYEYDDKVWGGDRAFFPDETLYYPYCDCEDRSILFTRLVRDLLGLKCTLVYYPGHLASAVCFTDNVAGDYISVSGKRYVVCDPTYIGAPVGHTMPGMDNASAQVIVLP